MTTRVGGCGDCNVSIHDVYTLNDQYYQKLGEVWDHETKDFKVLYKPLYCCGSKAGSYEAHHLATSTFERWERRFIPLKDCVVDSLPEEVRGHVVSRSSVQDLTGGNETLPRLSCSFPAAMLRGSARVTTMAEDPASPPACRSDSGFGSRSLDPYFVLDFAPNFQPMILEGKKRATTRVLKASAMNSEPDLQKIIDALRATSSDARPQSLQVAATVSDSGGGAPPQVFAQLRVTGVQSVAFSQLTPALAALEAFPCLDSFRACLLTFYPCLADCDTVHVFHFELA